MVTSSVVSRIISLAIIFSPALNAAKARESRLRPGHRAIGHQLQVRPIGEHRLPAAVDLQG